MNKVIYSILLLFLYNNTYSQIQYDSIKVFNHFETMGYTTGATSNQLHDLYCKNNTGLLRLTDNQTDSVNFILKSAKMKKLWQRHNSSSIIFVISYKDGIEHVGWITFFNDKVLIVDWEYQKDYWILNQNDMQYLDRLVLYYCPNYFPSESSY